MSTSTTDKLCKYSQCSAPCISFHYCKPHQDYISNNNLCYMCTKRKETTIGVVCEACYHIECENIKKTGKSGWD